MNCLVQMTGFRKRSKSIFNSNEKEKQLYNYSNIPFLSFFFSFSAWCWSNVIFNAFTFKNPVEYVFTLTALCPHLRLYEYLKSARLLNCAVSGVQERSMISLHNLQHSGFATIDYNNLFHFKVMCVFLQLPPSVRPFILRLWKNLIWRAWD